ncbi:translation initiation factor IF-2 [Thermoflexus hugenholtzii]|uniref:Translation initiation factor IF-2 n=1 Tax=Thermoflexus hugenholtzii JAD2 TaxID=877466 RepID=A0A212QJR1_9CHLR|nr:translation initiation factor IF-2 [Thermoflexus hugenholtzii]SNB59594.1 bacterial translation initiation factor 2 (bIF-2) [Thermoflexus hugenholtzii JAD2]
MRQNGRKEIEIPATITVRELAALMSVSPIDVIKVLMHNGIMASINQRIDYETAALVAHEFGFEPREQRPPEAVEEEGPSLLWQRLYAGEDPSKLKPRPPVVVVLGHVDHGKTTLLDAIRRTNVAAQEVGQITQRIGAYQVEYNGRKITFLDTPGHEAFTQMRARGAQVTDIAVLVVAADDGVMPQTREALAHARAARLPIIVALNKIDKPTANIERVMSQLAELGLVPQEYGGDTIVVKVSAKQRIGIEDLLEAILLVAETREIKANPDRPAVGTVIDARVDRRGPVATLLVQNGTLKQGDIIVAGATYGRVRAMFDDRGRPLKKAPPSTPVEVLGLSDVPEAGDLFEVAESERQARELAERRAAERQRQRQVRRMSLEDLYRRMQAGKVREFNVIIKTDVQGSIEPIAGLLQRLVERHAKDQLQLNILHADAGEISVSDVTLAAASDAIIIGFNVPVDAAAKRLAESEGVDIRVYSVIYHIEEDLEKALKGMLAPTIQERILGHAEVRQVFKVKGGQVAGCYVRDGEIRRNALVRVLRGGQKIHEGRIASLKRYKDDVTEVRAGYECGVGLEGFHDFAVGDILECFVREEVGAA